MRDQQPNQPLLPFRLFDDEADVAIVERKLAHWSRAGTVAFITWRTLDSMPAALVSQWFDDRDRWLRAHAIDPSATAGIAPAALPTRRGRG